MQIPKKCTNDFSQEVEEFRSHVKCMYMVIDRLISIEVLWEFFYSNTPIKSEL